MSTPQCVKAEVGRGGSVLLSGPASFFSHSGFPSNSAQCRRSCCFPFFIDGTQSGIDRHLQGNLLLENFVTPDPFGAGVGGKISMFDNLVESSSHKDDLTRKGSFLGVTALIYAVLIGAFFIAGIYWYDAHLGEMELELTTLVAPVPVPQQQKEPEVKQEAKPTKVEQNVDVRRELIADVTRT